MIGEEVVDEAQAPRLDHLQVAASVLGPRPRLVKGLDRFRGDRLGPSVAGAVADEVTRQCRPLDNVLYDADYRRRLLGTLVRRQLTIWAT